jgi:hypothetical protein
MKSRISSKHPSGLLQTALNNSKSNVQLISKKLLEHALLPLKLEDLILLLISSVLKTLWQIKNTAGLASVPKPRKKVGTLLVADHLSSIHILNFI